ncbi:hypothetical protein IJH29_00335 [Candidatus Saccharibacteria bacterium]|nr:hypothetical protein [Candidatus Saccharibacteria bacterium]
MSRSFNVNKLSKITPARCWVGETHKIIYGSREEAEIAARVAEHDHGPGLKLGVYKCEFGEHWHLKSE